MENNNLAKKKSREQRESQRKARNYREAENKAEESLDHCHSLGEEVLPANTSGGRNYRSAALAGENPTVIASCKYRMGLSSEVTLHSRLGFITPAPAMLGSNVIRGL